MMCLVCKTLSSKKSDQAESVVAVATIVRRFIEHNPLILLRYKTRYLYHGCLVVGLSYSSVVIKQNCYRFSRRLK